MVEPVPTKPTRLFSFTGFQTAQPIVPLPGNNLDQEIDRTNLAVADVVDFVRQTIDDDGRVRVGAITLTAGPQGPAGPAGPTGPEGASLSPDAIGPTASRTTYDAEALGFSFLDSTTGTIYFKQSATSADWSAGIAYGGGPQGTAGPAGPTGPQGATIFTILGTSPPSSGIGNDGDIAINAAAELFDKAGGVWTQRVSLVGPQGPQGVQGNTGPTGATGAQGVQGLQGPTGPIGPGGDMTGSNNLSEITTPATARGNLGLGNIATATRTVSALAPSGGADGDLWFQV